MAVSGALLAKVASRIHHRRQESLRFLLHDSGIQVIEIAPPRVETEMDGPGDAYTMTVDDFITEALWLMTRRPEAGEVIVSAARGLREAERTGRYAEQFAAVNPGPSLSPWT
jgi:uncharacterized oxidoreductase